MQLLITQVVHCVQLELPTHAVWAQVVGSPPSAVQRWKVAMSAVQVESKRHVSVRLQQLAMMHWLHGVPPGSSEQSPESMGGMPQ